MNIKTYLLFFLAILTLSGTSTAQNPEPDLNRELIIAVEKGNLKEIKTLLKKGGDVNLTIPSRSPFYMFFISRDTYLDGLKKGRVAAPVYINALHANASRANQKVLQLLLKNGANIDAGDSRGKTALMYALRQPGGEAYALQLLQQGANYTSRDESGNSTMHYAALGGNLESIQLTAAGGIGINSRNRDGMTPLHVAAIRSSQAVIERLLELGADLSAQDYQGMNALHYAAGFGSRDKVKYLYEKSPELFQEDQKGVNPLDIAYVAKNQEVAIYFRRKGHNFGDFRHGELLAAARSKNADELRLILRAGANPNRPCAQYPLHIAATNGDLASLRHLLRYDAKVEVLNEDNKTALQLSIEEGKPNCALILMEFGANVESRWLPSMIWNMRNPDLLKDWKACLEMMIEKAAQKDLPGGSLQIPALHCAAYLGLDGLAEKLLEVGADPQVKDQEGWTALHWAVIKRAVKKEIPEKVRLAKLLLKNGASPQARTTAPKELPHKVPYLAKRVPGNASPIDLMDYALPKDRNMQQLLEQAGSQPAMLAADFYENGQQLLKIKAYDAALVELNKALSREPQFAEAAYQRGICKQILGMTESAVVDFDVAISHRPVYPEAWFARGESKLVLELYAEAEADFSKALGQGFRTADLYFLRGRARLAIGELNGACEDFLLAEEKGSETAKMARKLNCKP